MIRYIFNILKTIFRKDDKTSVKVTTYGKHPELIKPWIRTNPENYSRPEDVYLILDYLTQFGQLNASGKEIENYWKKFSIDNYDCNWASTSSFNLRQFSYWLEDNT